jgi:hypothetical protein
VSWVKPLHLAEACIGLGLFFCFFCCVRGVFLFGGRKKRNKSLHTHTPWVIHRGGTGGNLRVECCSCCLLHIDFQ